MYTFEIKFVLLTTATRLFSNILIRIYC